MDSALAKNRLQHDCARVVIHGRAQVLEIVLLHERDIFQQWFKALAMLVLSGERQRSKRPAMIGTLECHQPALCISSGSMPRQPRKLDGSFNRLGSAIRKKCAKLLSRRSASQR